ncbi:winged helix-turn-helix transcriptional regulator [Gordonia neofelifaecis]|uniref:HxlR family transcriptional regulator n=1 Tax=Gordonia neofelifaecis NRRL B-59395 TaxID=644548 RepID=F1YLE3_9ACTN|nr:helix-turn-helix domain-containing protein [Gordonia neofelifaecis]EGD54337.1 HxlR family transcriptional regulator [Gordonia neofelifaecis NRRL B-59395]
MSEMPQADVDPTLEADVFSRNCSSREILQNVTSRWGLLALVALLDGELRFNALRRRVDGVSERMLSVTLQSLERDGYVRREMLQAIPPRVEYSLTESGRQVAVLLAGLIDLVEGQVGSVDGARQEYDAR